MNLLQVLKTFLTNLYLDFKIAFKHFINFLPKRVLLKGTNLITSLPKITTPFRRPLTSNYQSALDTRFGYKWLKSSSRSTGSLTHYLDIYFADKVTFVRTLFTNLFVFWRDTSILALDFIKRSFGEGFIYLRGLFLIGFIDALITDDEPIWEPVEWSLMQTWIMFIFLFAWIAENLITSRYGAYTGRDKRVWFSWYKTFWWIEGYYLLSLAAAVLFVVTPFYHELTYPMPFIVSWWNWYSRVFFFKFTNTFAIVLLVAHLLLISLRWSNWKTSFFLILTINFFLAYLLYCHFFMTLFGYLTDSTWFAKNRLVDYIQLSHEPNKWGWGPATRDHFNYHHTPTVFWFKNDGPFAAAFLFLHSFFFVFLFLLNFYWLTLLRRTYAIQEVSYTFTTYCVSALRQFFYFFLILHGFVFFSYLLNYWSFPIEFLWTLHPDSWVYNLWLIVKDYPTFLISLLK